MAFLASGQFQEQWGKKAFTGTWKALSELEVEVSRNDGLTLHYTMAAAKGTVQRREDPVGWTRLK
jgi:hypothetical protein